MQACPWCSEPATVVSVGDLFQVECSFCFSRGPRTPTVQAAEDGWDLLFRPRTVGRLTEFVGPEPNLATAHKLLRQALAEKNWLLVEQTRLFLPWARLCQTCADWLECWESGQSLGFGLCLSPEVKAQRDPAAPNQAAYYGGPDTPAEFSTGPAYGCRAHRAKE